MQQTRVTVLGIGNPIMGDDGTGLAVMERLKVKLGGGNPADVDATADEISWQPTAKKGGADAVSAPGLAEPDIVGGIGFVNGGTSGLELLEVIGGADKLLVLDAVTGPGKPGDVVVLRGDQVPRLLKSKLSPHQVGLLDLLASAQLIGQSPNEVAVVGIVALAAELGVGLSAPVTASLLDATDRAAEVISGWMD